MISRRIASAFSLSDKGRDMIACTAAAKSPGLSVCCELAGSAALFTAPGSELACFTGDFVWCSSPVPPIQVVIDNILMS